MKKGRITLIVLLMVIMTIVHYSSSPVVSKPWQPIASIQGTKYVLHDPIKILNDNDFASYGFDGLGTPFKPYLINGYRIESSTKDLIRIENTAVYFKISNCYLDGLGPYHGGIFLDNVTHGIIENNYIKDTFGGIFLSDSSCNTISYNTISNCARNAIGLVGSNHSTLSSNTISSGAMIGIGLDGSNHITLSSNSIDGCSDYGIMLSSNSNNITLSSNSITNCAYGIVSSANGTLSNNWIYSCSQHGIWLAGGSNNMLSYNRIFYCTKSGIYLITSSNNTLLGNTIDNCNEAGITLYESNNNTLFGNTIHNCNEAGITLYAINNNNTLSFNTIYNCAPYGIYLEAFNDNNNLSYNAIYLCASYGIYLTSANNDNNTLSSNTIYNNPDYGLYFEVGSDNNTVKWNNFIDNNAGTGNQQAYDDGGNNTFSTNYWHEWTSPDDNSDGFVDEPYAINGSTNNNDTSPLTTPVPPRVTILTPHAQDYGTKTITMRLSGNALPLGVPGGGGYEYFIEGLDTSNQYWLQDVIRTFDNDGTYTLHAYGRILSNISHTSVTFTIDTTPPAVNIDSPTETNYITNTITVNLSGDADVVHYWYYIEGIHDDNQMWTQNIDITLDDGDYILHAYGDDPVGNIASVSVTFTVDTVAPAITLESPTNDTTYNSGTIINVSVIDSHLETVLYNWDGATNKTWSGDYVTSLPADETQHILYVYANDSLGRWTSEVYVFTTDDTKPTIDITSPIETTYSQNNVTLTYTVSDGTVTIYINGETNTTALPSGTIIPDLPNRKHNITIVAVDQVGNIARATVIFTIDITMTSTTTTTTTSTTTSERTSETKSTPQVGSFPGLFTVLLFLVSIVVVLRRHKH